MRNSFLFSLKQIISGRLNLIKLSVDVALIQGPGQPVVQQFVKLAVIPDPGVGIAAGQDPVQILAGQSPLVCGILLQNRVSSLAFDDLSQRSTGTGVSHQFLLHLGVATDQLQELPGQGALMAVAGDGPAGVLHAGAIDPFFRGHLPAVNLEFEGSGDVVGIGGVGSVLGQCHRLKGHPSLVKEVVGHGHIVGRIVDLLYQF